MRRFGDPSRCAYAYAETQGDGVGFAFLSLFNDSNQYHLAVFGTGEDFASATNFTTAVVSNAQVGTLIVRGQPVVTNRQPMAGIITGGIAGSLPTPNFPVTRGSPFTSWPHDFPLLVLAPGWSLTGYTSAADSLFALDFWWEVILPDELLNPKIGDPDIDP